MHDPFFARPETIAKYEALPPGDRHNNVLYAAMTEDLDTGVGMVMDKVRDLGIEDNTYFFYVSDNAAHQWHSNNTPLFRGKSSIWEGGIRVPFVVQGPGIEAGAVSDVPVVTTDLYTTITELAGVSSPLPAGVEGGDLTPLLFNGGAFANGDDRLSRPYASNGELVFHFPHNIGVNTSFRQRPMSAIRDGDYKLLVYWGESGQPDELFLFNLAENVQESWNHHSPQNLELVMPEKAAAMHTRLLEYLDEVDGLLPYDVSQPVELEWDAATPGAKPGVWRSVIDVNQRQRESWAFTDTLPGRREVRPFQPGLPRESFVFQGHDSMSRKYFHVSDLRERQNTPDAGVPDFDRSTTIEFWFRTDDLAAEQILFESGDETQGLSLTLGDADGDGVHNDLRFRAAGDDGNSIAATAAIDRFTNPIRDFVHVVAVLDDRDDHRHATIFVNGAALATVAGGVGPAASIRWDGFDAAGLGDATGGLGGSGGTGDLPFAGGGFRGQIAAMRFYNYTVDARTIEDQYSSVLDRLDLGVGQLAGAMQLPARRPADLSEGASESEAAIWIVHERNDVLDERLEVDLLAAADTRFDADNSLTSGGALPENLQFASYILHHDDATVGNADLVEGSVTFDRPILGVFVEDASLSATDKLFGSIGRYAEELRGFDFEEGLFEISADLRTLTVSSTQDFFQLRVLTATTLASGDFDLDGVVDGDDFLLWQANFGTQGGASLLRGDANGDGSVDGDDFLIWQSQAAEESAGAGQSSVPEPTTAQIAIFLLAFAIGRVKTRARRGSP